MQLSLIFFLFLLSCSKLDLKPPARTQSAYQMVWSKNLDTKYETGNLAITSAHPVIHEHHLYVGDLAGVMRKYRLENGQEIAAWPSEGAISAAPLIRGSTLIYGTVQGKLYRRDIESGEILFEVDLGASVDSVPSYHQGRIFVHLRNHSVVALDASTGKILWSYRRSVSFLTSLHRSASPLIFEEKIILGFADGHVVSLSQDEGMIQWERQISRGGKFVDVDVPLLLVNNKLWAVANNSYLKALDPKTGDEIKIVPVEISSNLVWDEKNNQILAATPDGDILCIEEGDGVVSQQVKVSEQGISSVSLLGKELVVANFGGQLFYGDWETGFVKLFHFGHPRSSVFSYLASGRGHVAALSSRSRLYVFRSLTDFFSRL